MKPLPSDGEYGLYRLEDDIEEILARLGMVRPEEQLKLFTAAEPGYAGISTEQVELLDTDAIFLFGYDEAADRAAIEETRADRSSPGSPPSLPVTSSRSIQRTGTSRRRSPSSRCSPTSTPGSSPPWSTRHDPVATSRRTCDLPSPQPLSERSRHAY